MNGLFERYYVAMISLNARTGAHIVLMNFPYLLSMPNVILLFTARLRVRLGDVYCSVYPVVLETVIMIIINISWGNTGNCTVLERRRD